MSTRKKKGLDTVRGTGYGVPQIALRTAQITALYLEELKATSEHPGIVSMEREMQLLNASPTLHWMNKSAVLVAAGLAGPTYPTTLLPRSWPAATSPQTAFCASKSLSVRCPGTTTWTSHGMPWPGALSTTAPRRASRSTGSAAAHSSPLTD